MTPTPRPLLRLAVLALAAALAAPRGASADEPVSATVLTQRAPSVVHLKFVLKRGEREFRRHVPGTLVDASGIAVFSTSMLGVGGAGRSKASPIDPKIVFGADPKEYPAVLVAQDTKVDLAFVQILDLEGRDVVAVDLAKGGAVEIGQAVWQVSRKSSGYDYAPVVGTGYVSSRVEKPRALWGLSGDARVPGLPVYDATGAVLGIATTQVGAEGADEGMRRSAGTFLLPLDQATKSLEEARKKVPEAIEKAKAAKAAEPAKEPAKEPATEPEKPR
jgi:S1-C subfamily serine protease